MTGAIFVGVILAFRRGIVGTLQRMLSGRASPDSSSPAAPAVEGTAEP